MYLGIRMQHAATHTLLPEKSVTWQNLHQRASQGEDNFTERWILFVSLTDCVTPVFSYEQTGPAWHTNWKGGERHTNRMEREGAQQVMTECSEDE